MTTLILKGKIQPFYKNGTLEALRWNKNKTIKTDS